MLLSDRDILVEIDAGRVVVDPLSRDMIRPSSIDLKLDKSFRVFANTKYTHIDPFQQQDDLTPLLEVEDAFVLHPGEFALGSTLEKITIPGTLAGRLEGKSSLGRLGLLVHSTAGFVDPGFVGHVTLELSNMSNLPIILRPGMKIGQLCFIVLSSSVIHPYGDSYLGSKYQNQSGPTSSRYYLNFPGANTLRGAG